MKAFIKTIILFLATLTLVLSFSSCSSSGSEEKLIGDIDFGITKNQVIAQMNYSDDYYFEKDDNLYYEDIQIFNQYCVRARFKFENKELESILIEYPSGADLKTIFQSLEKAYGKQEDLFDDDDVFIWHQNGAQISFSKGDEKVAPHILIIKDKD